MLFIDFSRITSPRLYIHIKKPEPMLNRMLCVTPLPPHKKSKIHWRGGRASERGVLIRDKIISGTVQTEMRGTRLSLWRVADQIGEPDWRGADRDAEPDMTG